MSAEGKRDTDELREREARLAGLYEEYFDRIARYIYVRIGDRSEAEYLAGEVFVKALESLPSYKERGIPMQAWLFRIAHNLSVDRLRRKVKKTGTPIEEIPLESGDNPVATAENSNEMERVKEAMQKLTRDQQQVIQLRFFGNLSSKEVAVTLGKSNGAVREMQRAAVEKLRQLLAGDS